MSKTEKAKEALRKSWNWLWKSESWLSLVVFLILVFIIIKFVFFPLIGLIFGTQMPFAIVESCSMYHEGNLLSNYDQWWEYYQEKYVGHDINKEEFSDFKFRNGFNKGDILLITRATPNKLKIGDVIIFQAIQGKRPIIHRIIDIKQEDGRYVFSTLGDHNIAQMPIEKTIQEEQLIGKASFKIAPYIGWIKLIFYEPSRDPNDRGTCKSNY